MATAAVILQIVKAIAWLIWQPIKLAFKLAWWLVKMAAKLAWAVLKTIWYGVKGVFKAIFGKEKRSVKQQPTVRAKKVKVKA